MQTTWDKRSFFSFSRIVEELTRASKDTFEPLFRRLPMMGSVTLPAGPMKGKQVPFPHSLQDGEGLGIIGTANKAKVEAILPKPWKPVVTTEGRAVYSTWKDIERLNYLGQVCQRQWVVFYVEHPDDKKEKPVPVESPVQVLFGQFIGFHFYSYTHQMYTDCETVVEIDRNMYGWDSHLSVHKVERDIPGNMKWNVTSGGKKILEAKVRMPYGASEIPQYIPQLFKYGVPPLSQEPDQVLKLLKKSFHTFHW